jgi:centrin-1
MEKRFISPPGSRPRSRSRKTPMSEPAFSPEKHQRPGLSENEIKELKQMFDLVDVDGSGFIEPKDLKTAMESVGYEPSTSTLYQFFSDVDRDCSGTIDFDEFVDLMLSEEGYKDKRSDLEKLFRLFDDDLDGYISMRNLKRVMDEAGDNLTDLQLKEMLDRADYDKDGKVSFNDFYNILTRRTFY